MRNADGLWEEKSIKCGSVALPTGLINHCSAKNMNLARSDLTWAKST